jgi:hypothetical protein
MAPENDEETMAEAIQPPEPARRWWPIKANGDTPDPPHALTVLVQAVSATITLLALGFTVYFANRQFSNAEKAIAISEQGMKIGQRAYLTVRQGRLTVGPQISYWGPDPREPTEVIVTLPNCAFRPT